jgi:hypothetical protein
VTVVMRHPVTQFIAAGKNLAPLIAMRIAENFREPTKHQTPKRPASRNAIQPCHSNGH